MFTASNYLLILKENLEGKKIEIERWLGPSKKRTDEITDMPNPIIKAFNHEWKIFTLDTAGTFRVIDL